MSITVSRMLPLAQLPPVPEIVPDDLSSRFMRGHERNVLIELLNQIKAETMIEIGVQRGHCAQLVLKHVPSIKRYVGIDVFPEHRTTLKQQQSEVASDPGSLVFDDERFDLILREHGSSDVKPASLPQCDAILIDGDHSEQAVRNDTVLADAVVRPGGLIIWHDYWPPFKNTVVNVLDDLYFTQGRNIRFIPDTWLAMEVK